MAYQEVREHGSHGKLLFRYDPDTDRIEVVDRGVAYEICLDDYRPAYYYGRYREGIDSREETCYTTLRETG